MQTTIIIILAAAACIAVAWALAYHRANGVAWSIALAAGVAALEYARVAPAGLVVALWAGVGIFAVFSIVKALRRAVVTGPVFGVYKRILPQISQTEQEALDAGSIWWDADLFSGTPGLEEAPRLPAGEAHGRGAGFRRRPGGRALRDAGRVGHHPQPHGHAARGVEVHPRQGLPRHHHPQVVRRSRLLRLRALGDRDQDFHAQRHRGGERDGAQLPRAGGAPHPLRHRGAEEPLPAAPRQGPRDPVLRVDQPRGRIRRGLHPRLRHRLQGHARGPRGHRHPPHLGQALHHAGPGRDASSASRSSSSTPSASSAARRSWASRWRSCPRRTRV